MYIDVLLREEKTHKQNFYEERFKSFLIDGKKARKKIHAGKASRPFQTFLESKLID